MLDWHIFAFVNRYTPHVPAFAMSENHVFEKATPTKGPKSCLTLSGLPLRGVGRQGPAPGEGGRLSPQVKAERRRQPSCAEGRRIKRWRGSCEDDADLIFIVVENETNFVSAQSELARRTSSGELQEVDVTMHDA
jgi:hypothetical protein